METSGAQQSPLVDTSAEDSRLRAHIRLLGDLLGQTLVRQQGELLLSQVEAVRLAVRTDPTAAAAVLDQADLETATQLARSFSIYFLYSIHFKTGTFTPPSPSRPLWPPCYALT